MRIRVKVLSQSIAFPPVTHTDIAGMNLRAEQRRREVDNAATAGARNPTARKPYREGSNLELQSNHKF
jgi:hypothetical protein